MKINNNIQALNINKSMKKALAKQMKMTGKISSGLRINKASDDASGLSISEKMRAQIRGLQRASQNSSDGISLIQTGEGALNEISAILQRIRELSVQSANGSYNQEDRLSMQDEADQLIQEIDSISNNTHFNGIYLLNGNINPEETLDKLVGDITKSGGINDFYEYDRTKYAGALVDFSNMGQDDIKKLNGQGLHYTCTTCSKAYSIKFVSKDPDPSLLDENDPIMEVDIRSVNSGDQLVKEILKSAYGEEEPSPNINTLPSGLPLSSKAFAKHYSQLAADGGKLYIYDMRSGQYDSTKKWPDANNRGAFQANVYGDRNELLLDIQAGSNQDQVVSIIIPSTRIAALGLEDLSIKNQEDASAAISIIDSAIEKLSQIRSALGAYENRLEDTRTNLENSTLNLQAAESRIRDADLAEYIVELSKYDLLLQSSMLMMSKSNDMTKKIFFLNQILFHKRNLR